MVIQIKDSVVIVESENSTIDGLGIIHDRSKTIDTNVEQIESIVGFDGECDDVLQKELPVQSVHESEGINTVDKANDVNGDPNNTLMLQRIWLLKIPFLFLIMWRSVLWLRKIMFMMLCARNYPK
jgi:hypothetical protein